MGRYLLVAHQTADSVELSSRVVELLGEDPAAEFVLLVPAMSVGLFEAVGGESRTAIEVARMRARRALSLMDSIGARVTAARIGSADPFVAVEEEVRGGSYDVIIISTLPHGISRWLRVDLPARVSRRFPRVRVIHVVASAPRT